MRATLFASILLIPVIAITAFADPDTSTPRQQLESLDWLAGCWRGPHDGGIWEACYTTAEAGMVLSANKEIKHGRVVMIEFERFDVVDDQVVVVPYPFGRPSVPFKLVKHDKKKRRAEFANPEHDFPKRIVYHRMSKDSLHILVEGEQGGREIVMELKLKRE